MTIESWHLRRGLREGMGFREEKRSVIQEGRVQRIVGVCTAQNRVSEARKEERHSRQEVERSRAQEAEWPRSRETERPWKVKVV